MEVEQHLDIAARLESMSTSAESGPGFRVVVNLAVVRDDFLPGLIKDGLMPPAKPMMLNLCMPRWAP
jgi:hypothetical protein